MSTPVTLQPGTLPYDCYPSDPQTLYEDIINGTIAELDQNFPGIYVGADEPPPEYQDRVWFRTTDLQWYYYSNGHWVRPHNTPAGGQERRIWVGAESDVWSYDGGSGDNPSVVVPILASGAMWEVDHNLDARFPIGAGTLPSTTVVGVTGTGGEETHVLSETEGGLGDHIHPIGKSSNDVAQDDGYFPLGALKTVPAYSGFGIHGDSAAIALPQTTADMFTLKAGDGAGVTSSGHNNMPPYYGVFFIKRTNRTLYLA